MFEQRNVDHYITIADNVTAEKILDTHRDM